MKNLIWLVILFFITETMDAQQFNVITYNIRLNTSSDGINAWPNRADRVTDLLKFYEADLFGLQEVLADQLDDIKKRMPQYSWIGVGRDDGKNKGEYSPIFFRNDKFKLLDKGHFWLSETPDKPGKGWDAMFPRICVWAKLKIKGSGKKIFIYNTHFDHKGDIAREQSAILIGDTIVKMNSRNLPVILTGDFNLTPDKKAIALIEERLNNSRKVTLNRPFGPDATFNGFKFDSKPTELIDYIFVNNKIDVLKYGVLSDSENQRYPSDHFPVLAKLKIK